MTHILIAGDSHIYAIQDALAATPGLPGLTVEALRVQAEKNGTTIGDVSFDELVARAKDLPSGSLVVTALRGNQHQKVGLIQHPRPFDILMHNADGGLLQKDAEMIPLVIMKQYFDGTLKGGYGRDLVRLKQASAAPVVCLAPPAPKEDAQHIIRGAETYFRQHGISSIGVTPAPVRLKLWILQQDALARFCASNGLIFLGNPEGTRTDEGFLKPEFYAADATHANGAYGRLVLAQLSDLSRATDG